MFVDERSSSGVDEDGVGLHLLQAGGINQFAGGVGEGTVQTDDVAVGKEFVELRLSDFGGKLEGGFGGVGMHFHAETDGNAGGVVAKRKI